MKLKANSATFNGINWLSTTATTPTTLQPRVVVLACRRYAHHRLHHRDDRQLLALHLDADRHSGHGGQHDLSVDQHDDISALTNSAADQTTLDGYIAQVTAGINSVASAAANLGAVKNRLATNTEFVKTLMDSVDRGVGQLVDADMNAESTRLQALQTQQQLGVQALSIANQNSQSILSLFR